MTNKKRISKFEFLRVIAMYLIVLHHSIVHGALSISANQLKLHPINASILSVLESGGKIGVFLFVLITGYFMINSNITLKKIIRLWLPILFWSLIWYLIMGGVSGYSITVKGLIKSIFPIISAQYWFMTAYFFMYLLIPFLNIIVKNIVSKKKVIYAIVLGIVLIVASTSAFFESNAGSALLNFCVVYCWGGLIRTYHSKINQSLNAKLMSIFIFLELVGIELPLSGFLLTGKEQLLKISSKFVVAPSTLFMVLIAVTFFIYVSFWKDNYYPWINKIAATTFGIYLISDNNNVREFLWNNLLHMHTIISKNYAVIYVIVASLVVFIVCSLIEALRKKIFSKFENYIGNKAQRLQDKLLSRL